MTESVLRHPNTWVRPAKLATKASVKHLHIIGHSSLWGLQTIRYGVS